MEKILKVMLLRHKNKFFIGLTRNEYSIFLRKFLGLILKHGKKNLAVKWFHKFLFILKKFRLRWKKIGSYRVLYNAVNKFIPYVVKGKIKYGKSGKRFSVVPLKIEGNRKYVMILNFLFRILKRKTNIFKVNKNDVVRNIKECLNGHGLGLKNKVSYIKFAMKGRHYLKESNKDFKPKKVNLLTKSLPRVFKKKLVFNKKYRIFNKVLYKFDGRNS